MDEASAPKQVVRFSVLENAAAWKRLPPATKGAGQPLPAWARALADSLPRTTAALLELDYRHRAKSPLLEPALAAKMRLIAAQANGCAYTEAVALSDLKRLGGYNSPAVHHPPALRFAEKLTRAADTVTDDEVAD